MTEESSGAQIPKIWQPPQNSKCQKSDMNQLPYWGPTNINYNCTKFSDHGDQATRICAPLEQNNSKFCKQFVKLLFQQV
jgi:hypothetical protein